MTLHKYEDRGDKLPSTAYQSHPTDMGITLQHKFASNAGVRGRLDLLITALNDRFVEERMVGVKRRARSNSIVSINCK